MQGAGYSPETLGNNFLKSPEDAMKMETYFNDQVGVQDQGTGLDTSPGSTSSASHHSPDLSGSGPTCPGPGQGSDGRQMNQSLNKGRAPASALGPGWGSPVHSNNSPFYLDFLASYSCA